MKYLVMPEVWVDFLDRKISDLEPRSKRLRRLLEDDEEVVTTGLIMHQILHSLPDHKNKQKVLELFESLEYIEITREDYLAAGFMDDEDLFRNVHIVVAKRAQLQILE